LGDEPHLQHRVTVAWRLLSTVVGGVQRVQPVQAARLGPVAPATAGRVGRPIRGGAVRTGRRPIQAHDSRNGSNKKQGPLLSLT
jgi:hypothetical protein